MPRLTAAIAVYLLARYMTRSSSGPLIAAIVAGAFYNTIDTIVDPLWTSVDSALSGLSVVTS